MIDDLNNRIHLAAGRLVLFALLMSGCLVRLATGPASVNDATNVALQPAVQQLTGRAHEHPMLKHGVFFAFCLI